MTDLIKVLCVLACQLICLTTYSQNPTAGTSGLSFTVLKDDGGAAVGATVKLLKRGAPVKAAITDDAGNISFINLHKGQYTCTVSFTGYLPYTGVYNTPSAVNSDTIILQNAKTQLQQVTVTAKTPAIEHAQGKVIINVDASVTNAGTTVLEVLEKSPGVNVDRNGGISLQGKPGVLIMIDGKPTYLSGADLNNLLSSMSSSEVSKIELMPNPSARYDAAGNAGIINIKTKKNKQQGFNGTFTASAGHGVYPKSNNSIILNYRAGKVNSFLNYTMNYGEYLTDLYALRKYYDSDNNLVSMLDQPAYFAGTFFNNAVKTGFDYSITPKTTIGMVLSGTIVPRSGNNRSTATWLSPSGIADSVINTHNINDTYFKNGTINLNGRHAISAQQDIAFDADYLHYTINSEQNFTNNRAAPVGYNEQSRGNIPTTIRIASGKIDYTLRAKKEGSLQLGWKSSFTKTDNLASYQNFAGGTWQEDLRKSNHFLYDENIHALYASAEKKYGKLSAQAGLRYEHTGYRAHQLGNTVQADSAFKRDYGGLFPSGYLSYQADSVNSFTLTVSRRIDRPAFQNLNPFYFIINKYTYQTGNPYILPQYSWTFKLSHQFKELLNTAVSYSRITNYFSQLFLADSEKDVLLYTYGNVGSTYVVGLTESITTIPFKWWNVNATAVYNYKKLSGFNGSSYTTTINQLSINANNQFIIGNYTAELSGFYTTRARNDVAELLYPTGQLSAGVSRQILKKKATLKFTVRDIFYTNAMEGFTTFPNATEYFKMMRDTRVYTIAFTYRFGNAYKTGKRGSGSAADEMGRVGGG
ncbi:hypothetical protein DJ568_00875 [Mucilaginibacter hurinus]|uniref:Outer membrane protein beta-barrel domain-containing protein n=1 Tax=Mucilaginibacter hurinus TaxID=2201324 RepID=A0A367GSP0_9SPHI|nr:outer membrane beta-barrel family protein [Mucilaginibacter hurinus]RCH56444.1 hypothetical protein DJ568_00875 [Mucilaginibacter hurinus]